MLNVHYRNLHKFKKEKTENIMDYSDNRKSYFYWQWKIMQYEIKKYY